MYLYLNRLPEVPKMQFHMMTFLGDLGKIARVKIFYPRVKSQISLSGLQEFGYRGHWQRKSLARVEGMGGKTEISRLVLQYYNGFISWLK